MADLPNLTATDAPAPAANTNALTFALPAEAGDFTVDLARIPAETRLELLKNAVKTAIINRVNVANVRHGKANGAFEAFDKYTAAKAAYDADPISNANPGDAPEAPKGDRPAAIDLVALATAGAEALYSGELRKKGDGTAKTRTPKDPVDALVTQNVVRELFTKNKATDAKYTYPMAVKEVGASGTAFLKARIDTAVAAGADRAQLEKMLEARYLAPARMMAGVDGLKGKNAELPNIL